VPPTRIVVIRHGQSTWNAAGRWREQGGDRCDRVVDHGELGRLLARHHVQEVRRQTQSGNRRSYDSRAERHIVDIERIIGPQRLAAD